MSARGRLLAVSTLMGLAALRAAAAQADDTEIFFDRAHGVPANVLLIVDTSASMALTDGATATRLQSVQAGASALIETLDGVNLGLMRLSSNGGGLKLGRGEIAQRWMNALGHVLDLQPAANLDKGIVVVFCPSGQQGLSTLLSKNRQKNYPARRETILPL